MGSRSHQIDNILRVLRFHIAPEINRLKYAGVFRVDAVSVAWGLIGVEPSHGAIATTHKCVPGIGPYRCPSSMSEIEACLDGLLPS